MSKKIGFVNGCSAELDSKFTLDQITSTTVVFYRANNDPFWTANFVGGLCTEILEFEAEDFIQRKINFSDVIFKPDSKMVNEVVQSALEDRCGFRLLYRIQTASGKLKIIYEQGEGVFDKNGGLIELVGFITDISNLYYTETLKHQDLLKQCALEILKSSKCPTLSPREIETLAHLCQGMRMKEIAQKMHISPRTVEMNIRHAKIKLHCRSQIELRNLFYSTSSGKKLILETN